MRAKDIQHTMTFLFLTSAICCCFEARADDARTRNVDLVVIENSAVSAAGDAQGKPIPLKRTTSGGDEEWELWIVVGLRETIGGLVPDCKRDDLLKARSDKTIRVADTNPANSPSFDRKSWIGVCALKKSGQSFEAKSLNELGVSDIRLFDDGGQSVATAFDQEKRHWISSEDILTPALESAKFYSRKSGRWGKDEIARVDFVYQRANASVVSVHTHIKMTRSAFLHVSIEPFTAYGMRIHTDEKFVALPLVVALGANFTLTKGGFYLGTQAFLTASFAFTDTQISEILSAGLGARLDFGGWATVGGGVSLGVEEDADKNKKAKASGLIAISIGPRLLDKILMAK